MDSEYVPAQDDNESQDDNEYSMGNGIDALRPITATRGVTLHIQSLNILLDGWSRMVAPRGNVRCAR